jgi:hypothetical protein
MENYTMPVNPDLVGKFLEEKLKSIAASKPSIL